MSAICAVVARDGMPAESLWIAPLLTAAAHRGAERRYAVRTGAVLGCQHAPGVTGACVARLDDCTIAFHGRLDNRAEIRAALGAEPSRPAPAADDDAALVLRAFAAWQDGCAARLVGDFAFVIHDDTRRRVYAARDALGVKPLYYYVDGRRFVVATELTQVLASGVPRAPCEPFVAELLAFDVRSRHETLYQGILRLPPGHWMTVTGRDVCVRRYWAPNPHAELAPASDADYAAQCAELLGRVVADRAPAGGTTGAYLSGGLDSSSVVCAAHAIGRPIETFSMVFPDAPDADETPYIDAVCSHVRVPNHRRAMTAIDADRYVRTAGARADLPELPGDAIGWPLLEAMRDRGLTAALTGTGGDYGFTGSFSHYADLLRQGDVVELVRRLKHDRGTEDAGWSWQVLFSSGFRLLLPNPVRRAVRPVARTLGWGTQVPPWIDAAFARRTGLLDRLSVPLGPDDGALPSRVAVCGLFESGWTARLLEAGDRAAADYGIELRHPFFDRRLVEFAVALPERQRWRGATTKFVLREAMRERLPETVYARTGKADASAFVPRAIEALGGAPALERLRIAGAGWVDGAAIAAAYRRARLQFARGDEDYCAGMFPVWMALAVETWFVTMFVEDEAHGRAEGQGAAFGRERAGARGRWSGRAPAVSVPRTG